MPVLDLKGNVTRRMGYELHNVMKDCCVGLLADAKPLMFGVVIKCNLCDNRIKTVELDNYPVEDSRGTFSEIRVGKDSRSTPVAVRSLVFKKSMFKAFADMAQWATANGFRTDKATETRETVVFEQLAKTMFTPSLSHRVAKLAKGVMAEVAQLAPPAPVLKKPVAVLKMPSAEKYRPGQAPNAVEKQADGKCPCTHPVKWANKCWTNKAAAAGFPGDVSKTGTEKGDWKPSTPEENKWMADKVATLIGEGKPQDQAVAIAYSMGAKEFGGK